MIRNAISQFTAQEMQDAKQRIKQLFEGPSDTAGKISEQTDSLKKATAEKLIKKAEAILNQVSNEDQEDLVNLIEEIKDALTTYDESTLVNKTDQLSDMLFYLEENRL